MFGSIGMSASMRTVDIDVSVSAVREEPQSDGKYLSSISANLPYHEFFFDIMMCHNAGLIHSDATKSWPCLTNFVNESGSANFEYLCKRFGHAEVPVAECHEKDTYDSLQVHKWTFSKYLKYLEGDERRKLFYLKDWHFFQDFPLEPVYETPVYFSSDWLNEYWQECQSGKDDYRFVYFGPKGSWTPWHADVLRSDIYNSLKLHLVFNSNFTSKVSLMSFLEM